MFLNNNNETIPATIPPYISLFLKNMLQMTTATIVDCATLFFLGRDFLESGEVEFNCIGGYVDI